MKRIAILALLAGLLTVAAPLTAHTNHAPLLAQTVFPLQWFGVDEESGEPLLETHCSAFVVNPEHRGWMTAAHCVVDIETGLPDAVAYWIDGHAAEVLEVNRTDDLALLQTPDWGPKKGLKLATHAPRQGEIVENMGFSWGQLYPFYYVGYVASVQFDDFFFAGMTAIGGQSGSPVVNSEGRVVGVCHVRWGGGPFNDFSPLLGFTDYETLKKYDRGWVFSR